MMDQILGALGVVFLIFVVLGAGFVGMLVIASIWDAVRGPTL